MADAPVVNRPGTAGAGAGSSPPRSGDAPLTNPPATFDQLGQDAASQARAAIGGPAAAAAGDQPAGSEEQPGQFDTGAVRAGPIGAAPVRAARFRPPAEPEFDFTPPEPVELRNSNVPLTVGLLFSIIAAFVVFFVSLAGGSAGDDPILPAFWRALGALAVLMTLSFAASWFMPMPQDRRQLLNRLDAEDKAMGRDQVQRDTPAPTRERAISPVDEQAKGSTVDVTLDDRPAQEEPALPTDDDDYDFYEDDYVDFDANSPSPSGVIGE